MAITNKDKTSDFKPILIYVCDKCGWRHGYHREPKDFICKKKLCGGTIKYEGRKKKKEVIVK